MLSAGTFDGRHLLAISERYSGVSRIYDLGTFEPAGRRIGHSGKVQSTALLNTVGTVVLLAVVDVEVSRRKGGRDAEDQTIVESWDAATGKPVSKARLPALFVPHAIAAVQGGAVVGGQGKSLILREALTGKPIGRPFRPGGEIQNVSVSGRPGDDVVVAVTSRRRGYMIEAWRTRDRRRAFDPMPAGHGEPQAVVAGVLNGKDIVAFANGRGVEVRLLTGQMVFAVDIDASIQRLTLAPPSRIVVSTAKGLLALDWDA
jgi:hypothetical protein